ncbi:hypothetical protein C1637_19830 [Chryseobacterium lactis]|uniref:DUF3575 domain-containing protein n=2 Tax=Chryseobacterium lactis TaxID=1241981 RepID=A0A3G6RPV9_CHRLC|nr:hypothetical protein EG342_14985 [Chryseobacterium lactis]AZB03490.1 hypothetical protein EG341_05855 [Chryseobacterium lactis]PNW12006.1 hypothetical protein C1637_19830 [Chryseobacterium lactis]
MQAQDSAKQKSTFEIKPAVGATGTPIKPTLSVMVLHSLDHRFSIASHSMLSFLLFENTPDYITTNYNYSLSQKFGVGYSLYGKRRKARHSLFVLGGIRHITFKETMENPDLDKITVSTRSTVADYGLMYEFSLGKKRYTFDTRIYCPLSPIQYYPQGTLTNLVYLEMGIGIKLY